MKKIILGAIATAAAVAAIAAPANAAQPANHGQCVSSAVKAGVTGDAFTAIAKNNALVGVYGSATCPAPVVAPPQDQADADVTWAFDAGDTHITGTTTFNVTRDGGALAYTASDGHVLYGTITPGSYRKIDAHTAVFAGTIDGGSSADYLANPTGGNFFTAKIVDGGAPQDGHGDIIAVLANQSTPGVWLTSPIVDDATINYAMGMGTAGVVTGGNLTVS
jgi:hypothetical protein